MIGLPDEKQCNRLFVYGSLRRDWGSPMHRRMLAYCRYQSAGYLQARQTWMDGFPAAVLSTCSEHLLPGEIYVIADHDALFSLLDEYEDCAPGFPEPYPYVRRVCAVRQAQGRVLAWVYLLNPEISA